MKKVFIIHTRLVNGTGSPAIEDGMIVYETPAGEEKGSKIIYAGEMDYNLAETASKEDRVLDFEKKYTVTP